MAAAWDRLRKPLLGDYFLFFGFEHFPKLVYSGLSIRKSTLEDRTSLPLEVDGLLMQSFL
jgi:hypothetical protein